MNNKKIGLSDERVENEFISLLYKVYLEKFKVSPLYHNKRRKNSNSRKTSIVDESRIMICSISQKSFLSLLNFLEEKVGVKEGMEEEYKECRNFALFCDYHFSHLKRIKHSNYSPYLNIKIDEDNIIELGGVGFNVDYSIEEKRFLSLSFDYITKGDNNKYKFNHIDFDEFFKI